MKIHQFPAPKDMRASESDKIDASAFDVAYNFLSTKHILFEAEGSLGTSSRGKSIRRLSSRFDPTQQFFFVDNHVEKLSELASEFSQNLVPCYWENDSQKWVRVPHQINDDRNSKMVEQKCITLGHFIGVGPLRFFGFIIVDAVIDYRRENVDFFHGLASRLIAQSIRSKSVCASGILSEHEKQFLTWCARGKTNHEIGLIFSLSEHTVDSYFDAICSKLGAVSRCQSLARAIMLGVVSPQDLD